MRAFPRFADDPLRPAPPIATIELTVAVDGVSMSTWSADDLDGFRQIEQVSDFHCVTTWTYRDVHWGGIRFSEFAETVFGDAIPPYVVADAADETSAIYLTEDLDMDDVLLATKLGGRPLDRRHGAPLRLVSPGQYGYKNIKHLVGLDFRHVRPCSTMGPKEHLRARVTAEERHSTLPNWSVRLPYRLTVVPTALVAERTLRSSVR